MALYDDLMAGIQNGSLTYDQAVAKLTAGAGVTQDNYRQIGNLATASQGGPSMYTNTSDPVSHAGMPDASGAPTFTSGISQSAATNPYYQPGGAGYTALSPQIDSMTSAMTTAGLNAPQLPPTLSQNPNGSATANFSGGGSQTVTDPHAMSLLQSTYPGSSAGSSLPATGGGYPSASPTSSAVGTSSYASANPYLSNMADDIGRRTNLGLQDAFNSIRSNAVGVGGLGGSRQGVAQGVATGRAMDSLQGNLAGLFGGQYNADANRDLSKYGMDQGFYTAQRGQDLQQTGLGANIYDMGVKGGWTGLGNANSIFNTTAGNNVTSSNNGTQGGGLLGAAGGALGGAQLGNNLGLFGQNPTVGANWPTLGTQQYPQWGAASGPYGAWT